MKNVKRKAEARECEKPQKIKKDTKKTKVICFVRYEAINNIQSPKRFEVFICNLKAPLVFALNPKV